MAVTSDLDLSLQRELREVFERRFGHSLSERSNVELGAALQRLTRSAGFRSPAEYLALLRTLPLSAPMVQVMLQTVTNNESYFFRDPNSVASLRVHVLPSLVQRRSEARRLRVWSAGCSTGEELYTISILLRDLIPDIDFWDIALVGTDVDAAALARARQGHYKEWSLRVTPEAERKRYFDRIDERTYVLRRRFTRGAVFSLHNLADAGQAAPLPGQFDLILCRNVSIYMHEQARDVLAKKLARSLTSDGSWIAGPSDPLPTSGFSTRVLPGLLEHHREKRASSKPSNPAQHPEPGSRHPTDDVPTVRPPPRTPHTLVPVLPPAPIVPANQQTASREAAGPAELPEPVAPRFDDSLNTAQRLADGGDAQSAFRVIEKVIADHPLEAEAYLLRALLFESAEKLDEACQDLKRVIYLQPTCGEAHLRLGLLLFRTGQREVAIRALRNAVMLGYQDDPGAEDLRQTAAAQLMRTLRKEVSVD